MDAKTCPRGTNKIGNKCIRYFKKGDTVIVTAKSVGFNIRKGDIGTVIGKGKIHNEPGYKVHFPKSKFTPADIDYITIRPSEIRGL